jgi:carbohydrate-selective porin OprB
VARALNLLRLAIACLGCVLVSSYSAGAQQSAGTSQASTQSQFRCRHPADPHRRQYDCNDHEFTLDETLAGGWNNVRREMQRVGLTPTASYVGALQTNVTGGRDQVWSYAGLISFAVSADFGELIKIRGLSAYVGTSWGTGSNLAVSLDSAIPTSGLYAPSFYLGEMYLQQKLLGSKLTILAGRISAANAFAALPVFSNYVNYGVNPNPFSLGANDVTFFGPPPGTEWGAQASYTVRPQIQVVAGVFNTNVNSGNGENHGADFTFQERNKGVLAIAEIDYLRNQKENSVGKPGQITVGFLHNNNSLPYLSNPLKHSDGYSGTYVMAQQMVFRPNGPGTSRGATVWGTWTFDSKDVITPIPLFWGAGVSYEGLIPMRKMDIISASLVRTEASKFASPINSEQVLELNYQWSHSRYLAITPHAEYLWKPNSPEGRNATVLGIQLALTL